MAKASSSVTQTPLATLAVVAAVGVVAAALLVSMTEAAWSVQARFRNIPVELSERFVATTTPLANEIYEIRFRNLDDVLFEQELQNDKSVLIGSCTSSVSVTANKYGWAYWRSSFNFSASVELSVIQLSMRQQAGYSPTQTEVISCGVGLPGANGRVYAKSQLSEADRYVSFTIRPSTSVGTYVFFSCTSPVRTTQQIYDETAIRDNGLCIQIWMSGDVWLQSLVAQLVQHLDCTSTDVDACNAFRAMARNPKYFAYDAVNAPQALTIAVPRAVTRSFNPSQNLVIGFALPQDRGQMYGLKNIAYRGIVEDNNFTISGWNDPFLRPLFRLVDVVTTPGTPAPLGTTVLNMVMTENCLRGRNSSLATCPMVFLIVLDAATQADLDVSAPTAASDFAELGWYSNRTGAYFPSTFTASIAYTPAENGKRLGMFVTVSGYEGYDVAAVDVVQVYLPYSLFNSRGGSSPREPPTYNLTITVLPSAGNITSELTMDATKEILLWGGGFQRRITLGGESFTEAFASSFLNLTRVVGAADPAGGWEIWKRCALPAHAIYFERNAMTQAVDRRVLVLDFQPCPQYTMTVNNEVIEIDLPTQYLASGIPLATPPSIPLQFLITRSTPIFTWRGQDVWTVDDVLEGDVTFQIILQGGTTFRDGRSDLNIAADCAAQLRQLSYMSTNAPYRLGDGAGWNNSNVRASLLNANALTYIPDAYGTLTILNVTFPGNTAYFTLQGENISFAAIPAACVATSQDVIPPLGGLPPLQIKARVGVVSVLGAVAPDVAQAPLTQIAATNIRQGDVSLVIAAKANTDTFSQVLDGDALFSRKVADGIRCVSPQPFGFRALRLRIVNVSFVSPLEVRVRFMPVPQFAITTTELVSIGINGSWMSSRNEPTFATNTSFTILPSPGSIELVDAFVLQAPVVTEDDVRAGRLWFQFALIGDQWRQERAPYVAMFSGPAGEGTGLLALIDQLVPSIEFFNFTSSDTFQYLTVTLQSSDVYDISATETVKIAFSADAASSGLAPQFDQGDGTFAFSIQPTAGRLVVSGQTQLTEKLIREGGSTIFLTLFGDQWVALGATECVRQNTRITTSASRAALFEASILPSTAFMLVSTRVMSIRFEGDRRYVLPSGSNSVDLLVLLPNASCFRGKQLPPQLPVTVSITKTRGELSVAARRVAVSPLGVPQLTAPSQFDLDESALRSDSTATVVEVVVDGNAWNLDGLAYTPSEHRDVSLGDLLQRPTPCTCGDLWNATLPMDAYSGGLYCACSAPPTNATEGRGSNVTLRCPSSNLLSLLADAAATSPASGVQLPVCNASISLGLSATTWLASYEVQCHCNETTHHDTPPMLPDVRLPAAFNGSIVAPTIRTHCVCSLIDGDYNVTAERLALLDAGWVYSGLSAVDVLVNVSRLRILLRSALASSASPLEEPAGFAAKKDQIVLDTLTPRALSTTTAGSSATTTARNVVHVLVNATTLTIALAAAASYDIIEDEAISFTLTDPSLMSDGLAPDPASASFAVAALPLTVGMVYQPPGGQFSGAVLQSGVGSVLSMSSTTDAAIRVVQTGRRGIAFVVELQFNVTPSSVDPRTNAELTNHLLALSSTFLTSNLGVLCAVVNGTNCSVREADDGGAEGAATSDATSPVVWFFATVAVVVVVGLLTYVSLVFRNTKLSGSMRRKFEEPGEPVPYVDGGGPKSAERIPIADVAQPPMSLREFVKRRNMTTSDDVYFTERDLQALEDEPDSPDDGSGWAAARADPRRQTLDAVMEEQRRSQRVDEQVLRRRSDSSGGVTVRTAAEGARRAQRAVDLRADFQL